ncbi:unnamed protein product [Rotaria sp. Silwood1]|nr:unnamed protein product [Rotaria sp. Silwood1]CAF4898852.1 unnamed protein product [Rotaria sp. Silwood1]
MIDSLFIINETGDAFMEKHWKTVISKSICDYFYEAQKKCVNPEDIPPVIATPHHYLINIYRNNLYFIAIVTNEGKYFYFILIFCLSVLNINI